MTRSCESMKVSTISIVIPARNEAGFIDQCLSAIRGMKTSAAEVEIVVVDNNSTDDTAAISKTYGATVVTKKEGSIGSLRNAGAAVSKGDFIAFLDADCIVPGDWLERALSFFAGDRRMIIGFRMTIPGDANWVARCWDILFSKRNVTAEVEWLPSGNMIMTRQAFLSIGGFDEGLETNEDCDLCFRLGKRGYRVLSCADTAVVHLRPPRSLSQVFKKELWHGKEIFKVFVGDVMQSKDFNITRRKNSKIVLYALCNLAFILTFLFSLVVAFSMKILLPLGIALALPFITSFVLAWAYTRSHKDKKMIVGLTILLVVYGLSRAVSILPYEKVLRIGVKV